MKNSPRFSSNADEDIGMHINISQTVVSGWNSAVILLSQHGGRISAARGSVWIALPWLSRIVSE